MEFDIYSSLLGVVSVMLAFGIPIIIVIFKGNQRINEVDRRLDKVDWRLDDIEKSVQNKADKETINKAREASFLVSVHSEQADTNMGGLRVMINSLPNESDHTS